MRERTIPKLPGAESDSGKSGLTMMTNRNIWKMFVLFLAVAVLNTFYITLYILIPEAENQRYDRQLYSSFTVKKSVNRTEAKAIDNAGDEFLEDTDDDENDPEDVGVDENDPEDVGVDENDPGNTDDDENDPEDVGVNENDPGNTNDDENDPEDADQVIHNITKVAVQDHVIVVRSEKKNSMQTAQADSPDKVILNITKAVVKDHFGKVEWPVRAKQTDSPQFSPKNQNENATNHVTNHIITNHITNHVRVTTPETRNGAKNSSAQTKEIEIKYTPRVLPKHSKNRLKNNPEKKKRRRRHKKDHNRTITVEQRAKWGFVATAPMSNVSNAVYYKNIPSEFLVGDPSLFVWDRPELRIPEWMKDYFRWHRWKRSTWNEPSDSKGEEDWIESERWLISQCLMSQDKRKCGGTADRLKPLPVLLRIAYENKRVFLIRWTRPAPLEEFLLPPIGGFDWRLPPYLEAMLEDKDRGKRLPTRKLILHYAQTGLSLVRARYQTGQPASSYDELVFVPNSTEIGTQDDRTEFGFDLLFSRVWKVLFTPSPPIQDLLRSKISSLGLVPNEYVSSHLRALYATEDRPLDEIWRFTENALACATKAYSGVPIFFASDSAEALRYAQDFNGRDVHDVAQNRSIHLRVLTAADQAVPTSGETVTIKNNTIIAQPWHLDSYIGPVENFYDTFVDLYMLAMAGCVSYNKGGYGHWAMLIGGHTQCQLRQHMMGKKVKNPDVQYCKFKSTYFTQNTIFARFHKSHPSMFGNDTRNLFLPPMD